jgi:hypothetical protein
VPPTLDHEPHHLPLVVHLYPTTEQ